MQNEYRTRIHGGWLLAWATFLVCLLFVLQELWLRHPAYHFVPLPLGALAWLVAKDSRRQPLGRQHPVAVRWLALLHLLVALVAFVFVSPFIAGISLVLGMVVYGLAFERSTQQDPPRWAFPALALFLVPPPLMLDNRLHQILAGLAARLSQSWLDAVHLLHVVEGTIVVTPECRFFVDDACSGTNSMLVATCVALILCSFERRSTLHALAVLLSAALISIASNVLRICVVIGSLHFWNIELDHGFPHDLLGIAFFALDLFLIWSADRGWHFLLHIGSLPPKPRITAGPLVPSFNGLWLSRVSVVIALTGALVLTGPTILAHSSTHASISPLASIDGMDLPGILGLWSRDGEQPLENSLIGNLGVRNQVWLYRKGNLEAYVAVNYPFTGFHDTRLCYNGQGWQFEQQVDGALPGDNENTVRYLKMNQPADLTQANLWLCVFDERGIPQKFTSENPMDRVTDRLLTRWTEPEQSPTTIVLQVLAVEPDSSSEMHSAYTELLADARAALSYALSHRQPQTH